MVYKILHRINIPWLGAQRLFMAWYICRGKCASKTFSPFGNSLLHRVVGSHEKLFDSVSCFTRLTFWQFSLLLFLFHFLTHLFAFLPLHALLIFVTLSFLLLLYSLLSYTFLTLLTSFFLILPIFLSYFLLSYHILPKLFYFPFLHFYITSYSSSIFTFLSILLSYLLLSYPFFVSLSPYFLHSSFNTFLLLTLLTYFSYFLLPTFTIPCTFHNFSITFFSLTLLIVSNFTKYLTVCLLLY